MVTADRDEATHEAAHNSSSEVVTFFAHRIFALCGGPLVANQESEGVPVAPIDIVVIMKLLAGRTQDLADVEAIIASGADRDFLRTAVQNATPELADTLERLFKNVDRSR